MPDWGDFAKVVKLGAMIAATGLTGGLASSLAPAISLGADMLGASDDGDADEHAWQLRMIPEWRKLCLGLMKQHMSDKVRSHTLKNKMASDWFIQYGYWPKQRYVDKLSADVVMSVKAELAVAGAIH